MQINRLTNSQIIHKRQGFKGNERSPYSAFPIYQSIPLNVSKAYAFPQIKQGYKQIEVFDVPYVGKGKLYELTNGHQLVVIQKPGTFVLNTCVKAGHDKEPVTGHFLEHLIYNLNNDVDGQTLYNTLDDMGTTHKAATDSSYTTYTLSTPFNDPESIEKLIKIQAQLLQAPKINDYKIEKEKEILLSEYSEKLNETDSSDINLLMFNTLLNLNEKPSMTYQEIDPINRVKATTAGQITSFYDKYYNNNNMVTFIVGDVNPDKVVGIFSKYFNKPNNTALNKDKIKVDLSTPIKTTKRIDTQVKSKLENNVNVCFVGPDNNDIKNNLILDALALYIDNEGLDYKMESLNTKGYPTNHSIIYFCTDADRGKEEVKLKELYQNLYDLTQKNISDDDLALLKLKLKTRDSILNETSLVMSDIVADDYIENNKVALYESFNYIDKLTKQDLQNYAKKYIDFNKALVLVAHDNSEIEKSSASPSFTGSSKEIDTKYMTEYIYPNTLQLLVDNSEGIKRTTYSLNLTATEMPKAKPGVTKLLKYMIEDNIKDNKLSKSTIVMDPEYDIKQNGMGLSVSVMPEQTAEAISLVNSTLQHPQFSQESLDINKTALKAYYKELAKDKYIALIHQQEYGNYQLKDRLEGLSSYEDIEKCIDAIQLSDVSDLYNHIITNAQGKAILVTPKDLFDKHKSELLGQIGSGFSTLKPKQIIDFADKSHIKPIDKTKVIINQTNGNYSEIFQEFQIINSKNLKDNLSIELIVNILGDGKRGRLNSDIRQKQGLAYTAGSYYETDGTLGYLNIGMEPVLEKDLKVGLGSLNNSVESLLNIPVSDIELARAKKRFKADILTAMDFSSGRQSLLKDYGLDNIKKLFKEIDEITPRDIQSTAQKYFTKPSIIIINSNKDILAANKTYLLKLGDVIDCQQ